MSFIHAKNLTHKYPLHDKEGNITSTITALEGIELNIKPGQFIGILGGNASGKSTLAKHFNALLYPDEGVVEIDGMDSQNPENLWDIRKTAGMVFQNPDNQILSTVVEEDVGFGPENIGIPTKDIWERVAFALEATGMSAYASTSPYHLSGGQKQRIAIAGIVAMRPKCIILDEATAMLDPQGRNEVLEVLKRLNRQEKVTILFITHYMEEVIEADYIYVMNQGKIAMQGTPKEIFSQSERLYQNGLEVPVITQIANQLRQKGCNIPEGILTIEELVEVLCP